MTLDNSSVSNNFSFGGGAVISNRGTMKLANSTVSDNGGEYYGNGGIANGGNMTISNSRIVKNRGGEKASRWRAQQ